MLMLNVNAKEEKEELKNVISPPPPSKDDNCETLNLKQWDLIYALPVSHWSH